MKQETVTKLNSMLKLLNEDSVSIKDIKKFLAFVTKIIENTKEEFNTLSKENVNKITKSLILIEKLKEEIEKDNNNKSSDINKTIKESIDFINERITSLRRDFDKDLDETKKILREVKAIKVTPGKDGEPGKDANEDSIVERLVSKIPKVEPYVLLGVNIVNEINDLPITSDLQIDASHIKNLPKMVQNQIGGVVARNIYQMGDVVLTSLANNDVLKWDDTNKRWVNGVGGGGGGGVDTVTGTPPIVVDNTDVTNPIVSIPQASTSDDGYLSSTDWDTFNAKQGIIALTTSGSSGASTFDGSTLNVPNYTLSGLGMTFGTDNQMPFTNATGTGFEYSAEGIFDGHTMLLGTGNTISSTYKLQLEESANKAVYMLVRHNTSGTNSTAQLAVITPTAGGFFGAFDNSHNQAAWRDKAMFGAYSTASGIQIAAYNSGQKIWFQVGGLAASSIWATMLATGHLSLASNLDPLTNLHIQEATTETLPAVYINQTSTGDSALQFSIVGDAYAMGIDNSDNDSFKISYSATAGAAVLGTNDRFVILATGEVGIGTTNIGAKLHVLNTTQQLRLGYDASNYFATTVDSNGLTTFDATGAGAGFVFDDTVTVQVLLTNTGITPDADDGAFLGQAGLAWSDLFLAEGAVINWDSGDITITQTGDTLAFAGGTNYTFNDRITASGEIVFDGTTTSSGAGAIGVTGSIHEITTTGIGDALTLADGVEGQRLTIVYVAEGAGTDTAVLTPTNFGSGTTITFATIGQSARLLFTNAKWYADGSPFGAVIA